MIVDRLENSTLYHHLGPRITQAFNYLKGNNFTDWSAGTYEIDGENMFAMMNLYNSHDRRKSELEAHKKYIDVQFLAAGTELIGYAPLKHQIPSTTYDETHDYMFFNEPCSYIRMETGMFAIFFPSDLHKPGIFDESPSAVKKVVVKVLI